ncbi:MAG: tyrosine-type recombinase/integrase [Acidimicrobiia bacterium]|nr:tyrosine-type recombinase/integrase [Acidimicrobiia bacterium]
MSATRIPANKGKRYPTEVLTPDEVRALIRACPDDTPVGLRNRALIALFYRTGLQCAEALALRQKDIDRVIGSVTVLSGKGGRRRTVGIDPGAFKVIDEWLDTRRELGIDSVAPLFCSMEGRRLSGSYVRMLLPRLARDAGIEKRVHAHGLRHTHAFELLMEGIEIPVIQRQLGHLSLQTTDTYLSHIAPRDVIRRINERSWSL